MGSSESVPEKSVHEFSVKVTYIYIYNHIPISLSVFLSELMKIFISEDRVKSYLQNSKGQDVDLSIYKGKVLLIVNVASKWFFPFSQNLFINLILLVFSYLGLRLVSLIDNYCNFFFSFLFYLFWGVGYVCGKLGWNSGFTDSNYTQLTELYTKYKEKGMTFARTLIVRNEHGPVRVFFRRFVKSPLKFYCNHRLCEEF